MLEPKPPRRDPRILALHVEKGGVSFAALDAWEIRGLGRVDREDDASLELSLRRLVVQTKPSAIVCSKPRSFRGVRAALRVVALVARHSGIPLVSLAGELLRELVEEVPTESAVALHYPELRALDADDAADSAEALKVALAAFAKIPLPPRRYAPTLAANSSSPVDIRRPARDCAPPLRDDASARRRTRHRRSRRRRRSQDPRRRQAPRDPSSDGKPR